MDTISPLPLGSPVVIRITHEGRAFEATAVVVYAHFQMGMGLAFTEIGLEDRAVLRSWLAELSGETGPELVSPGPPLAPIETPSPQTPSPPASAPPAAAPATAEGNLRFVTHELITLLVRKKVITEEEGTGLLREMFR